MSYQRIKWMILFLPTVTIGLWEYIRHQWLMPYLSMEAGNWLSPLIVYIVSITLLRGLFSLMENTRTALDQERMIKGKLEERQQLAGELHDGVAQSLFLLGVRLDQAKRKFDNPEVVQLLNDLSRTVSEANHDVRQAIADLKHAPRAEGAEEETLEYRIREMLPLAGVRTEVKWQLDDDCFTSAEQAELLACIREALLNVHKHAGARTAFISGTGHNRQWTITVEDDGNGYNEAATQAEGRFGLRITRERAEQRGWKFDFYRQNERTYFMLTGGTKHG